MKEVKHKKVHTVGFNLYNIVENSNLVTESISVVAWGQNSGLGEKRMREELEKGLRNLSGVVDMYVTLTVVMI